MVLEGEDKFCGGRLTKCTPLGDRDPMLVLL